LAESSGTLVSPNNTMFIAQTIVELLSDDEYVDLAQTTNTKKFLSKCSTKEISNKAKSFYL
jgi:hypothetical protein